MIRKIFYGDITSPENRRDIVIGMNVTLDDVTGIGLPFVHEIKLTHPLTLGGVLSFEYDDGRQVHMLLCHRIGKGGWKDADRYVRFGLDFLWHTDPDRPYSIVQVGTGRVGCRDGADAPAIHAAIANSHLLVDLFIFDPAARVAASSAAAIPLRPRRAWTPAHGIERLAA